MGRGRVDIDLGADGPAAMRRHTQDAVIPGTRKITARTVASDPLDHYAATGTLQHDEYQAGMRLRRLLSRSLLAPRCTAPARYVSAGSEYDEEGEVEDEETRWQAQKGGWAVVDHAAIVVGRDNWPTVRAVCEGYWIGRLGDARRLVVGLRALVVEWGK